MEAIKMNEAQKLTALLSSFQNKAKITKQDKRYIMNELKKLSRDDIIQECDYLLNRFSLYNLGNDKLTMLVFKDLARRERAKKGALDVKKAVSEYFDSDNKIYEHVATQFKNNMNNYISRWR